MRVGILTYQRVCNYGANLQLLSTIGYFKKHGYIPIVINYIDESLSSFYQNNTPTIEYECFKQFWDDVLPLSKTCHNPEQIATVLEEENIEAVIIGSDAVAQHHPLFERIIFSTRTLLAVKKITRDRLFPNPFWGTFVDYLDKPIPVCQMSVSSQDSAYKLISPRIKSQIRKRILGMAYTSVRDSWTQNMFKYITKAQVVPQITPDPVFAFNSNAYELIPSREQIIHKYNLPEKYVLFSFLNNHTVSGKWLADIETIFLSRGIHSVSLTFPQGMGHISPFQKRIDIPINPLDWYALIKYSNGYIGHNMHPIVVCIHNGIPFYSFDNYGTRRFNGYVVDESSSKIKHILDLAGLSQNRSSCLDRNFIPPTPEHIVNLILGFDCNSSFAFAQYYLKQYKVMMDDIIKAIAK